MESRSKLLGHPIHPMLVVFPLGLLSTAVVFDIAYLVTGNEDLAVFSFWAIAAGLVGAPGMISRLWMAVGSADSRMSRAALEMLRASSRSG